jgi:hypothetical protein
MSKWAMILLLQNQSEGGLVNITIPELAGYLLWGAAMFAAWVDVNATHHSVPTLVAIMLSMAGSTLIVTAGQHRTRETISHLLRIATMENHDEGLRRIR